MATFEDLMLSDRLLEAVVKRSGLLRTVLWRTEKSSRSPFRVRVLPVSMSIDISGGEFGHHDLGGLWRKYVAGLVGDTAEVMVRFARMHQRKLTYRAFRVDKDSTNRKTLTYDELGVFVAVEFRRMRLEGADLVRVTASVQAEMTEGERDPRERTRESFVKSRN